MVSGLGRVGGIVPRTRQRCFFPPRNQEPSPCVSLSPRARGASKALLSPDAARCGPASAWRPLLPGAASDPRNEARGCCRCCPPPLQLPGREGTQLSPTSSIFNHYLNPRGNEQTSGLGALGIFSAVGRVYSERVFHNKLFLGQRRSAPARALPSTRPPGPGRAPPLDGGACSGRPGREAGGDPARPGPRSAESICVVNLS